MMKVGDMIQWRDQKNYPRLCGIVTQSRKDNSSLARFHPHEAREIFVHWLIFPKDYEVDAGWEKVNNVELLSTGETE